MMFSEGQTTPEMAGVPAPREGGWGDDKVQGAQRFNCFTLLPKARRLRSRVEKKQLDSGRNTTSPLFKEQKLLKGIPFCVQLDANHPELKITRVGNQDPSRSPSWSHRLCLWAGEREREKERGTEGLRPGLHSAALLLPVRYFSSSKRKQSPICVSH